MLLSRSTRNILKTQNRKDFCEQVTCFRQAPENINKVKGAKGNIPGRCPQSIRGFQIDYFLLKVDQNGKYEIEKI